MFVSISLPIAKTGWRTALTFLTSAIVFLSLSVIGAEAAAQIPLGCDQTAAAPSAGLPPMTLGEPYNLDLYKQQILTYRCTKYVSDVAAVLSAAQRWVEERAAQVTKPAIVLDIDETSLSNWTRIFTDGYAYFPNGPCDLRKKGEACGDLAWEKSAQAPALLPTLQLFNAAKCRYAAESSACSKVAVFFVTGRRQGAAARGWTERNLRHAGYRDWDGLYMRDGGKSVAEFKTGARAKIENRGYTIIANVGDQESDLVGGHAERTFKVPDPFYFVP